MDKMNNENNDGVWAIIHTATRAHISRLSGFKTFTNDVRTQVLGMIKNNSGLTFDIMLDYFSPLARIPVTDARGQMVADPHNPGRPLTNIGRESILTNFEYLLEVSPTYCFNIEKIKFVDEMTSKDKSLSNQMINDALNNILQRRMADVGLVSPDDTSMIERLVKEGKMSTTRMPDTPDGKPHFKVDLR